MSSNKSEHFQLHLWNPQDDFLREEFNENFNKLDGAAQLFFGVYTGDGAETRHIELGFQPNALLLVRQNGEMGYRSDASCGGLMINGYPLRLTGSEPTLLAAIDESGFIVRSFADTRYFYTNQSGVFYHYMAITI